MPTIMRDKVTAGAVTFNEVATQPAEAVVWGMDVLDGWDESAELDVAAPKKGGGSDGLSFADYFASGGRAVTMGGYVLARSRADADTLIDVIHRDVIPPNEDVRLERAEPIAKFINVRLAGPVSIKRTRDGTGFRWAAPVLSESPFKFDAAPPASSSGSAGVAGLSTGGRSYPRTYPLTYTTVSGGADNSVTLINRGTAYAWPIATLSGPLERGGWRLSNETTGEFIRFDVGLLTGDELLIDFAEQSAYLNDVLVTSTIIGDFWKVEPGSNVIKLYADYDAAAGFTASIVSAWR